MLKEKQKTLLYLRNKFKNNHISTNKSNSDTNRTTPTSILKRTNPIESKKSTFSLIQKKVFMRYNTTPEQFDNIRFENVIQSKYCHELAVFKEKILFDYTEEFLKRYYKRKESKERIPKFVLYYRNYLTFFCKATFSELNLNDIIQSYGEKKAQLFYNENYKEEDKDNKTNKKEDNIIFTDNVRKNISTTTITSMSLEESFSSLIAKRKIKEITSVNNTTLIKLMTELANDKREKKALMLSKKQLGKNNVKMIYNNYNSIMKKKHTKNNLTLPNKIASLTERCINESSKNKTITSTNRKTLNVHSRNAINGILSNHRHIVSLSKKIFKTTHNDITKKNHIHSKNTLSTQFASLSKNIRKNSTSKPATERKNSKLSSMPIFTEKKKSSRNEKKTNVCYSTMKKKKSHVVLKTTIGDFFKTTETPLIYQTLQLPSTESKNRSGRRIGSASKKKGTKVFSNSKITYSLKP